MRDKIEKVLDNNIDYYGTSKEDLLNELCVLFGVSNCANKIERPSPYKWIKKLDITDVVVPKGTVCGYCNNTGWDSYPNHDTTPRPCPECQH